jgi:myo-inositol 2-dehydrogenase/D-chiro-inositol 1-dehydrogenase
VLEMRGGALVDIEVFMTAGYGYDVRAELVCEQGCLERRPVDPVRRCHAGSESTAVAGDWRGHFAAAYQRQLQAWVAALQAGTPAGGASAWDGYAATAAAAACVQALQTGRRTELALAPRPAFYA